MLNIEFDVGHGDRCVLYYLQILDRQMINKTEAVATNHGEPNNYAVDMKLNDSRLGLEQEFFIVDSQGFLSHRADEVLECCWQVAQKSDRPTDCFAPEFVKSIIEINTAHVDSFSELTAEYLDLLKILIAVTKSLDLRIYPLSTYPLYATPVMRNKPNYHLQVRTIGEEGRTAVRFYLKIICKHYLTRITR